MQQRRIHHAENRCRRAHSQGNRQNRDGAEPRRLAQRAHPVTHILRDMLEPIPAPGHAAFFTQVDRVAELSPRRRARILGRQPRGALLLLPQFHMQPHFLGELSVKLAPPHQHPQPPCHFAQPVHRATPPSIAAFTPPRSPAQSRPSRARTATSPRPIVCVPAPSVGSNERDGYPPSCPTSPSPSL